MTTAFNFVELDKRENVASEAKDFKSVLVLLNEVICIAYFVAVCLNSVLYRRQAQREASAKFSDRETIDKVIQHLLIEKKIMNTMDTPRNKDNTSDETAPSTVRTDLSASMKFIGNLKNPYEVIKKTPDIDGILMALSEVGFIRILRCKYERTIQMLFSV